MISQICFFQYCGTDCLFLLYTGGYFFVSADLGTNGLTALNLAFPVFCMISGAGLMIGIGGSSRFSILKSRSESKTADQIFTNGAGLMIGIGGSSRFSILKSRSESKTADQIFTNAFILVFMFAAIFFFAGFFASRPLTKLLGANNQVFEITNIYLKTLMLFAPAFMLNHLLQCFVRNDGHPSQ